MQPDFSYLKKEAQYRLDSFIHLDDAQFLFCQNGFHQSVIKDFLIAITQFYSGIRIILESRIIPPVGIFPEKIHKSVRIQGIDKESMRLYFHKPFKDDNFGWDLIGNEQESILKNFGGIKEKEKIHPLAMTLLASMAKQTHNTPAEILKNTDTLQKFRDESRELLLDDLNLLASQTENWNIPQNLEMYHEDIPGYLSESLQKSINELFPGSIIEAPPVSDTITDNLEKELRKAVSEESYLEGKKLLLEIKDLDLDRFECLKEEFGFIYDFDNPETDETNRKPKQGQLQWRRKVWQFLSMRNNFEIPDSDLGEVEKEKTNIPEAQADIGDGIRDRKIPVAKDKKTSEAIGEDLEKAVLKLFKDFFAIMEEDNTLILENARQQGRGLQFGHDLKFVCGRLGNKEIRLLIECKNYSDKITTKDIADKLMEVEDYYDVIPIDHWILISPHADLANELERFIEKWENKGKYPFKVQTWTPATRVKEFFGLDPDIYDRIIKAHDLNIHPKEWSADKRKGIIEYWKEKLEPPLRLPQGWQDYLREPDKLLLEQKEKEFEKRFANDEYVKMNYKDETGPAFAQPLEEKILQWLEEPVSESPTIFLLGEFGDGKTFFTYVLTRKLAEKFRASPKEGWLPVRFALKNFESEGFNRTQDFIQHRLNDFRADIAGWNELRSRGYKLLAILDGFDEISKGLDPKTILSNINILIKCYTSDYFSDMKLMITSRKHFFENQKDKDKLLDKLDKPQLLHLSPIDRKTTEDYLRMYAARIGKEENFNKIKECHDPIGLASKPLFLEMVQVSLNEPPGKNLNEYILYEDYIKKALKRKKEYSSDNENETPMEEIIENLKNVLELVAQRLHQSDREYVFLSDIREKEELKAWLWELSDPDTTCIADETGHIAARSLLKRVDAGGQHADKQWPVDFCHRSMREYFVARAVCNMVEKKLEEAEKFLTGCVLSHEIVFFAGEIMKNKSKDCDYEKHLLKLIEKTRNVENIKRMDLKHLGSNA
ncbi:MAG TPA: NACHT domain-containing protein, partial [Candidatus Kapabacteria bacterium]|nr:NACHT domain-containing protein [Candidatus Kapabacteria bacterium]